MTNKEKQELPRGIRNNNPGNIRAVTEYSWRGQIGVDSAGFCIFNKAVDGLRAMCVLWANYHRFHGCNTIRAYIDRWAPPTENNTDAYVNYVSEAVGVGPDEPIDVHMHAVQMLAAVVHYENGEQPYTTKVLQSAVTMSHVL